MPDPIFTFNAINPFGLSNVGRGVKPTFADIDGDGDLDALIGERHGNTLFFENTGTVSNPAFAAAITNPFGLTDVGWNAAPILVDIDGDGDLDTLIGNSDGNTLFFENTGTARNPVFLPPSTNPFGLSVVDRNAVPTFVDIDGDGDFDAFVGEYKGKTKFFENTGTTNSPAFALRINSSSLSMPQNSSPTFVDIDGDGDFDAFVGSDHYFGFSEVSFLRNTGTTSNPTFYRESSNPFGLSDAGRYTAPIFVDIDNDGDFDSFVGNSSGNIVFSQNTGIGYSPSFNRSNSFGLNVTTDYINHPTFVDIDGDGDLDAFAGSAYYFSDSGDSGDTLFYENTGTANNPDFSVSAVITNPFGLNNVGYSSSPTFADIDGDDDLDAFIGNSGGDTLFFENMGTASSPVFVAAITNPFGLSDVGARSDPIFVDIDNDGDFDAFIGSSVNTVFFQNIGTSVSPIFAAPQIDPFGLSDSNPTFVDVDKDGDLDVFAGIHNTQFYWNTGTANNPVFSYGGLSPFSLPEDHGRGNIRETTFADIDGDGDLDAYVVGGYGYGGGYPWTSFFINNNAPNVVNLNAPETYTENTSLNLTDIVVSDVDSANISVVLTLSIITSGSLSTGTSGDVTSTFNSTTGVWAASGAIANVNTLLADVIFTPTTGFKSTFSISTSISDDVSSPLRGSKDLTASSNILLFSTAGDDILIGTSSDNATVSYSNAPAPVTVSLLINTQQDTIGHGLDTLIDIENLVGSDFNDNLTGNTKDNTLNGEAGNDILRGWSGADTMIGGLGDDSYFVENLGDVIIEQLRQGTDHVTSKVTYTLPVNVENLTLKGSTSAINGTGNDLANHITGNAADNQINGMGGDDTLIGKAGNDTLRGWSGADTMIGGPGNDSYFVENLGDVVIEQPNEGTDHVTSKITYTLPANVENLTLKGSTLAIDGTGNDLANNITGNAADNQIIGGNGNDILNGKAGNDTLRGSSGADIMIGGPGNDRYSVESLGDAVIEQSNQGTDHVNSKITYTLPDHVENLTLKGTLTINGTGNDLANRLNGNSAANQLNGGGGNDRLDGKAGADTLVGGLNNDTYIVDNAGDIVIENFSQGRDTIKSTVTYTLPDNVEKLTLTGSSAIDGTGNSKRNTLTGNSADNQLDGGAGNDKLDGKGGNNILTGGTGKDIFKFTTGGYIDTITDFDVSKDTIQLDNAVFTALTSTGTLAADQFVIGAAALDANDFVIYDDTAGSLLYDADGNGAGAAVQIAVVGASLAMTNADIVVI